MKHNGCGPKSWESNAIGRAGLWAIRHLLLGWFYDASCDRHDEGYREGGDDTRRKVCDDKFLSAMKTDVQRLTPILRPIAYPVAYGMYAAVRLGGKSSFNYTN